MKITVSAPGMNPSTDTEAQGSAAEGTETKEYDLPEGTTVEDLLSRLGITAYTPEMVLINGDQSELDTELHEGDDVALGGPVGGV